MFGLVVLEILWKIFKNKDSSKFPTCSFVCRWWMHLWGNIIIHLLVQFKELAAFVNLKNNLIPIINIEWWHTNIGSTKSFPFVIPCYLLMMIIDSDYEWNDCFRHSFDWKIDLSLGIWESLFWDLKQYGKGLSETGHKDVSLIQYQWLYFFPGIVHWGLVLYQIEKTRNGKNHRQRLLRPPYLFVFVVVGGGFLFVCLCARMF